MEELALKSLIQISKHGAHGIKCHNILIPTLSQFQPVITPFTSKFRLNRFDSVTPGLGAIEFVSFWSVILD